MSSSIVNHVVGPVNYLTLLFFISQDQYLIEQEIRKIGNFHEDYVIGIIRCHDGESDPAFQQEVERRGLQKYPYCIVMPAADRNLQAIISAERIAGRDWTQIKTVCVSSSAMSSCCLADVRFTCLFYVIC